MKKFLEIQETLTVKEKIELFQSLYKDLAGHGINGDTELAHVNSYEAVVLKAMGGSGTLNKVTGLRQYDWLWGGDDDDSPPPPAPTSTTVKQVSDLPEYFKPYAEELLSTAQQVYDRPYVPYGSRLVEQDDGSFTIEALEGEDPGKRLADVSEEQKLAFQGLRDFFTKVDPETGERSFQSPVQDEIAEAKRMAGRGGRGFDELAEGEFQETYMSPYQKAVTDIQTREAKRQQEQARQQRQTAAMSANALGGSRFGVQEALAREADRRLLSDIELKGLQDAYTQGLSVFDADRSAARQGATQYSGLGQQEQASTLTGLGSLQTLGETQRSLAQQPLDVAYEEFVRQQEYPKKSLQELSGILRGFQVQPSTYKTSQEYQQPPTLGSQLLTAGSLAAGISGGLGKSLFGKAGGGLASIAPERYQEGGSSTYGDGEFQLTDITAFLADKAKDIPGLSSVLNWNRDAHQAIMGESPPETFRGFGENTTEIDVFTEIFPDHSISEARAKWNALSPTAKNNLMDKYKTRKESSAIVSALTASDADVQRQIKKDIITGGDPEANVINQGIEKAKALVTGGTQDEIKALGKKQEGLTSIEKKRVADLTETPKGKTRIVSQEPLERKNIEAITSEDIFAAQEGPEGSEVIEEKDETIFDFNKALPWLKMAAAFSQSGKTTSGAALDALKGYEEGETARAKSALELRKAKAQEAYYRSLASKSKADALIAAAKAGETVTNRQIQTVIETIKVQIKGLQKKIEYGEELTEPEKAEYHSLRKDLQDLRRQFGPRYSKIKNPNVKRVDEEG